MVPGARLVVLGKQGAGKGTQCVRLSHHYVVPHVSTGDMLRAAVKQGTAIGQKAKDQMDRGELLGDDLIMDMVAVRLGESDVRARGFVLDGCPRTVAQAERLADILAPFDLDLAIDIEIHTGQVLRRLAARRVCVDCGANYSLSSPPLINWTCDVCGGEVDPAGGRHRRGDLPPPGALRDPDRPAHRVVPGRNQLESVPGTGSPDAVTRRMVKVIEMRRQTERCAGSMRLHDETQRRGAGQDAQGRPGGGRDPRGHQGGHPPRGLDRRNRPGGPRGARAPWRGLQLPQLPRLPGGGLHLAQLDDRARHPGDVIIEEGDIISVDCGAIIEGYHGDAAYTVGVGEVSAEATRLMEVTEQSLFAGIEQLRPGNRLHEVGRAVQEVAEAAGFSVVREYVGHAIGTAMHEEPQVPNYWPGSPGPTLKPGMVFAVEPMVNAGGPGRSSSTTGGVWSPPTARCRPTSSTPLR